MLTVTTLIGDFPLCVSPLFNVPLKSNGTSYSGVLLIGLTNIVGKRFYRTVALLKLYISGLFSPLICYLPIRFAYIMSFFHGTMDPGVLPGLRFVVMLVIPFGCTHVT